MLAKLDCTGLCGDVVEFGCGYGTFTIPAAQLNQGRVLALDIDPVMTQATFEKAQAASLTNIVVLERDFVLQGTGLNDKEAEFVMLFNILHIEQPLKLLKEAWRVLKLGGKLGIVHWRTDVETPRGPSKTIRPSTIQCRNWAEEAGFQYVREESLCCCSWHWGLLMQRPD
ncbi:MAG: class I SAM-dependent methyltransferase [Gemmatales bacterium]